MSDLTEAGSGKNKLFNDSKLGVLATGGLAVVFDGALDGLLTALTSVDTSGWNGWWTTVASALLATVIGLVTAFKAKRKSRNI
jgi:hypothetical protein